MDAVTVWVLARPDDSSLPVLAEAPPGVRLVVGSRPADFAGAAPADAILVCSLKREALDPVLALVPRVRWVHSRAAGVDAILSPALVASAAVVTSGRGVFSRPLAEFVVGALLFFAKGFRRMVRSQEAGRWDPFEAEDVAGRTLGIVGYGDIGRTVAVRARALGMRVLALRRRPELSSGDGLADEILPLEGRLDLLRRADDVVVSLPLTADTRHLVGEAELAAMKKTAVLVNVGAVRWWTRPRSCARSRRAGSAAPRSTSSRRSRCRPAIPSTEWTTVALAPLRRPHDGLAGRGDALLPPEPRPLPPGRGPRERGRQTARLLSRPHFLGLREASSSLAAARSRWAKPANCCPEKSASAPSIATWAPV